MKIKLSSVQFGQTKFRKLQNLTIPISERITVIGGLNGIGKSTILGLIANCSGIRSATYKSYFDSSYQANFQELFHLDENDDYNNISDERAYVDITYTFNGDFFTKRCSVSKHTEKSGDGDVVETRLKIVPRTISDHKELGEELKIGGSAKVPIPTIYLGMSRMTPIGEYEKDRIKLTKVRSIDPEDKTYIQKLFNDVVSFDLTNLDDPIIDHDFKGSKKRSKLPTLKHSTFSISLGQDSLSSIFTALASFKKIKREMAADYQGGLLIIDEIDAGLHHVAQIKLLSLLKRESRSLDLQIIFTTHSLTIFKDVLNIPERQLSLGKASDSVVYLHNTPSPKILNNPTYLRIKNNQLSQAVTETSISIETQNIKIYLEDDEGKFFLEKILNFKEINDFVGVYGVDLDLLSLKVGCNSLMNLFRADNYFKTVVIVPDNDILSEGVNKKIIEENQQFCPLPADKRFNSSTPSTDRNPEKIIYDFLNSKLNNYNYDDLFWQQILSINDGLFDYDYIKNTIINIPDRRSDGSNFSKPREKMKSWFNLHKSFIENARIIELWCSENIEEIDVFCEKFKKSIAFASQKDV